MNPNDSFMALVKDAAKKVEDLLGIPARFAIAQAANESRYGLSKLSAEANNYFGIKDEIKATVRREIVEFDTREFINGKWLTVIAKFAKYASVADCFTDWGNYIVRKYPAAYACAKAGDRYGFFSGLQRGGYATDPNYASRLCAVYIELFGRTEGIV